MKALITGASSGIGRDMARYLASMNYDLILVARDKKALNDVKESLDNDVNVISMDLGNIDNVYKLYEKVKGEDIDILINNAGFGDLGLFIKTDIDKELNMIDVNINAVHILTKLFLKDFVKRDSGYILNVASSAAFEPGPLMATYYSTKAYVLRLTTSIYEELRRNKSNVHISVLCPGPVNTNFNNVANVKFDIKSISSEYCAEYAIKKMFKNKLIIIPSFYMKTGIFFTRFIPTKMMARIAYNIQSKKR